MDPRTARSPRSRSTITTPRTSTHGRERGLALRSRPSARPIPSTRSRRQAASFRTGLATVLLGPVGRTLHPPRSRSGSERASVSAARWCSMPSNLNS
jgi:hypothetical protein